MLVKIAWRNIWRSKLRSLVVIIAIALGIWAGVFLISFSAGINNQRTQDALESTIGHVQIHSPEFNIEPNVSYWLHNSRAYAEVLDTSRWVKGYSQRIVLNGMVSSAQSASGARIVGVNEEAEKLTSNIYEKVVGGSWFKDQRKNQIVIGKKLAEKHKLRLKSKVVLSFQDEEGNILTGLFRVGGIYKSSNSKWDEMNVFVRSRDLQSILGVFDRYHEIVIMVTDVAHVHALVEQVALLNVKDEVKTWKEVAPDLAYANEAMAQFLFAYMSIIMAALLFGIVNNMLMAILERKKELGMLMAVGLNKVRLFAMIMIETIFLGLVGGPSGMFLGWLTIKLTEKNGLDLSILSEGLQSFGFASIIYPVFDNSYFAIITLMVVTTTIFASIYPAYKALKLNPVEAIRSV